MACNETLAMGSWVAQAFSSRASVSTCSTNQFIRTASPVNAVDCRGCGCFAARESHGHAQPLQPANWKTMGDPRSSCFCACRAPGCGGHEVEVPGQDRRSSSLRSPTATPARAGQIDHGDSLRRTTKPENGLNQIMCGSGKEVIAGVQKTCQRAADDRPVRNMRDAWLPWLRD